MNIVFIGSGRLATNLAKELYKKSYNISQIYSRTIESATLLADIVNAEATDKLIDIRQDAELYIFAVKDSVLPQIIRQLPSNDALWIHTSGSISINVFEHSVKRYGVLYPFQTFSKERSINFNDVPLCYEANNRSDASILNKICASISDRIYELSSEKRQYIHLSGVFACNFVNHMYDIAGEILGEQNIPSDILLPLIDETASKIHSLSPHKAQTGPAVRYDKNIIDKHIMLIEDLRVKSIYTLLSESIYEVNKKEK